MLVILVLCCLQLGACAVGQEDTTFGEISRIETLDETLQDPDFDARAESAGKEHGSINIESGLPPASSVEAHMGQQQAHGGPRSQRELQQFKLQDQAVDTSLTNRHEPLHRFQEESVHSRGLSRTLLQDSFGSVTFSSKISSDREVHNSAPVAFVLRPNMRIAVHMLGRIKELASGKFKALKLLGTISAPGVVLAAFSSLKTSSLRSGELEGC
ncbi:hypothetical protein AXG93_3507s1390 [Marchantia polymorpha subsp. ruderalis]|uniref:Uncharacterized protein n=1 Tax=Marchantia polymorpha subsp. ruderalis TaxID=1480154 RepID=A0A176VF97_MARPO|nr:hypothetical protein AXG93_3507s1390 [Marchantia polymorpha subsp. ruderalis]